MLDLRSRVCDDGAETAGQDGKGGTDSSSLSAVAEEIEKMAVVTCLIMLKKEADLRRFQAIMMACGAVGGS